MNSFPQKLADLEPYQGRFEARRITGEKADVYFATYPAGSVIPSHSHDTENYGLITKGALYLTVNGREQRFGIGEWYHVPRHALHAARFEEDTAEIELWFKA